MKIVEVRDESALGELKAGWDGLVRSTATATIFQTWDWAVAWWSAYGRSGELRILTAFDAEGVLRGIAPLRAETARRYALAVPTFRFLGDGSNDSDYLDFIVAPGCDRPVMQAFNEYLAEQAGLGTVLRLNEIPEHSRTLPFLTGMALGGDLIRQEADVPCGSVALPNRWEEYLAELRPRFRGKIRSTLRNLEVRRDVRFRICRTAEELNLLLPALFDLHTKRWNRDGKPGVFGWDQKRKFYSELSRLLLDRGWLRLTWLEWNERILACQYGLIFNGTYSQLQEGYEPEAEHWSPGIGLRAWSIRELIGEGLREYDFLGGMGRHKSDWGAKLKHSKRILLAHRSARSLLFCQGPEWEIRLRESLRELTPERVLAMRKAYRERPSRALSGQNGSPHTPKAESWPRKVAARLYVDSPLPALVRPLRDRYRLFISHNQNWPGISWERRVGTSGRILYYHRVNEENDPFFPACPAHLFDRQMRFVARRHTVIGLSELLDRIERGDPLGSMLAITFDDGYRDNYEHAFPILRRYGLPATIFLTTGSMDDRQPLWFEKLAGALKKTDREFVDVEIDLPRRFWLGTERDRLAANDRIFGLLRGLSDADRQSWYEEILRRLGTPDLEERKDRMLTWDQAREMKKHRIDFGGHTVTHPFLSKMTTEAAAWEISESKRRIEDELQSPAEHFAYPSGREKDFAAWNKDLLHAAGYRSALTTIWGMNDQSTDRFELRRGQPWDADMALFALKLDWYQLME